MRYATDISILQMGDGDTERVSNLAKVTKLRYMLTRMVELRFKPSDDDGVF